MTNSIQKNVTGKTKKSLISQNMLKDLEPIQKLVQDYLKPVPLIIWGSGGTIPFGMPSMEKLKEDLELTGKGNFEKILSKIKDEKKIIFYQNKIFDFINEADAKLRENIDAHPAQDVLELFRYFYNAHPHYVNIVTTNYDCFLEYLFSYNELPYTDGFSGREFSAFDENRFNIKKSINIIKVHGSLRWNEEGKYSCYNKSMKAVYPRKDKYRAVIDSPFRELIQLSDQKIKDAKTLLIIGFGFNDDHLMPKIERAISKTDLKIVVVTKQATDNTLKMIHNSHKFVLLEEEKSDINKTKVTYKKNRDSEIHTTILEDNYWQLPKFKTMLTTGG